MAVLTREIADQLIAEQGLDVVIPNIYTSIESRAFHREYGDENKLTSVIIPDSVTSIGSHAFSNNQLTSVDIGNSVTFIGDAAFQNNQLTSITIPISIASIGANVFYGNNLTSVTIPNSVTSIGTGAFAFNQLASLTIPSSVTSVGNAAFAVNKLTSIEIPSSITSIGYGTFESNQLTSVTLPSSITTIQGRAFLSNQLTGITLPNSITSIGGGAFQLNQISSIIIPSSVRSIGAAAFRTNQLTSVEIPNSVTSIGIFAFEGNFLGSVAIPNAVRVIERGVFSNNLLTSIAIPKGINSIEQDAFTGNQIASVTIPYGIWSLDPFAFDNGVEIIKLAPPTDISLSASAFAENIPTGSIVATLNSVDPNANETHTYALVNGTGDTDNDKFIIEGNQLKIVGSPDFETQSSYSIRVQTKDSGDLTFEKSFTLSVNDLNEVPTDISSSSSTFDENIPVGSVVATLSSTDPDAGDTHTYSLVTGDGDTDNSAFTIDGDQLKVVDSPDFETKSSYSIRVQTKDSGDLTFEKEFTLDVNDLNEVPTNLSVSTSSFDENIPGGSVVATLSSIDPDAGDTHTYSLITGDGDTDNNAFTIVGNQFKVVDSPDFETKSSYSVRLQTKDSGDLTFEKAFTLTVNDLPDGGGNEIPADFLRYNWNAVLSSTSATDVIHDENQLYILGFLSEVTRTGTLESFTVDGTKVNQVSILPQGTDRFDPRCFTKANNGFNLIALDQDYDLFPVNQINLISIDTSGKVIWSNTIATGTRPDRFDIGNASNHTYIVGTTQEETIFISKYDNEGNMSWNSSNITPESNSSYAHSIAIGANGNIYFGGSTDRGRDREGLIGMSDANGNINWILNVGTTSYDTILDIAVDDYGNVYYIGYSYSNGGGDVLVGSVSSSGQLLWQNTFGGNGQDWGTSLSISGESVIAVGYTNNGIDGYDGFLGGRNGFAFSLNTSSGSIQSTKYIGAEGEHLTLTESLIYGNTLFLSGHRTKGYESQGIIYSYDFLTNNAPSNLSVSASTFDENIPGGSVVATLTTMDPDEDDTHTYSLVSGDGDTDNSSFKINGDQLIINESPDFETQSTYSIRVQTKDSGDLTFAKEFTLTVNDLDETPNPPLEDLDGDGFVDGVTHYQMWTESGGVDLTNKRGRKFSDQTSGLWDAIKAVQTDSGFSILIYHETKDKTYKVWTTDSLGVINSQSRWKTGDQMMSGGYEDIFDLDLNEDEIIGKPPMQDIDEDGFVDGVSQYQIYTDDNRELYLKNRNGRRIFSDDTSPIWDAVKTFIDKYDSMIHTLIEGTAKKDGKFRVWFSDIDNGHLSAQTFWKTEKWMVRNNYENIFDYDINDNGVIGS